MEFKKTTEKIFYVDEDTIIEFCHKIGIGYFVRYNYYGMNFLQIDESDYINLIEHFKNKVVLDEGSFVISYHVIKYIESYWGCTKYGGTIQCYGLQTSIDSKTYKHLKKILPKKEKKKKD